MATPPFKYQPMFEKGKDTTEYYLLTKDYVSVSEFEGNPILKIEKEGLTAMANAAFRDVSFMLRRSHNEQVAKILSDPEASENDKYVALTFLRNAEVAAKGVLPFCQDTGTAIIHGEKGQQVWLYRRGSSVTGCLQNIYRRKPALLSECASEYV